MLIAVDGAASGVFALAAVITSLATLVAAAGAIVVGLRANSKSKDNAGAIVAQGEDIDKLRADREECRKQLATVRRRLRELRAEVKAK